MKKKSMRRIPAIMLTMALGMAMLAGCSDNEGVSHEVTASSEESTSQEVIASSEESTSQEQTASQGGETETTVSSGESASDGSKESETEPEAGEEFLVSSVEEFVEAVRPGARIVIAPGKYNQTDYLKSFSDDAAIKAWNEKHPYVQIMKEFDGLEIVIQNADGLCIEGQTESFADTEIVTEPRHADVLSFINCNDLEIRNFTMGHTMTGDCSGDVLWLQGCQNVLIESMDLYGCGVYGIGAHEFTGNVEVVDCVIRDCAYGPFNVYDGEGDFTFRNCTLTGSYGGGFIEMSRNSKLYLIGCKFGTHETNRWYFDERAVIEDPEWSEITEYPDYGEEYVYPDYEG